MIYFQVRHSATLPMNSTNTKHPISVSSSKMRKKEKETRVKRAKKCANKHRRNERGEKKINNVKVSDNQLNQQEEDNGNGNNEDSVTLS